MTRQQTLEKIQLDIEQGDLGKARDRLHGLLSSYPDDLSIRKQLGELYWQLHLPEMAGRYWYLEEEKDEQMVQACRCFESRFNHNEALMFLAIKFKGQFEPLRETYAGQTITRLNQDARQKYSWFAYFQDNVSPKELSTKNDPEKHRIRDRLIKFSVITLIVFLIFTMCVGLISIINWF
jgi:hypothetical protein